MLVKNMTSKRITTFADLQAIVHAFSKIFNPGRKPEEIENLLIRELSSIAKTKKLAKQKASELIWQGKIFFNEETFTETLSRSLNLKNFLDEYVRAIFANYLFKPDQKKDLLFKYLEQSGMSKEEIAKIYRLNNSEKSTYLDFNQQKINFYLLFLLFSYRNCSDPAFSKILAGEIIDAHLKPLLRKCNFLMGENHDERADLDSEVTLIYLAQIQQIKNETNPKDFTEVFNKMQVSYIKFQLRDLQRNSFKQGVTQIPRFYRREKLLAVANYLANQVILRLDRENFLNQEKLNVGLETLKLEKLKPPANLKINEYKKFLKDFLFKYLKENFKENPKVITPETLENIEEENEEDWKTETSQNKKEKLASEKSFAEQIKNLVVELGFSENLFDLSETMLNHLTEIKFSLNDSSESLPSKLNEEFSSQSLEAVEKIKAIFNHLFVLDAPKPEENIYKLAVFFLKHIIDIRQTDIVFSLGIGNDSAVMAIDYKLKIDLLTISDLSLADFVSGLLSEYFSLTDDPNLSLREICSVLTKFGKDNHFTSPELQNFSQEFLKNDFRSDIFALKKEKLKNLLKQLKTSLTECFQEFINSDQSKNKGEKIRALIEKLIRENLLINGKYGSRENFYNYLYQGLLIIQTRSFLKNLSRELIGSERVTDLIKLQEKLFGDFKAKPEKIADNLAELTKAKPLAEKVKEIIESREKLGKELTRNIYDTEYEDFKEFILYCQEKLIKAIESEPENNYENFIDFSKLFTHEEFDLKLWESLNSIFYFFFNAIDSLFHFEKTPENVSKAVFLITFSAYQDYQAYLDSEKLENLIKRKIEYCRFIRKNQEKEINKLEILAIQAGDK